MGGCGQLFLTKGFERSLGILQSQITKKPEVHVKVFDKYTVFNRESPWVLTTVNHKRNLSSSREREKEKGMDVLPCYANRVLDSTILCAVRPL